MSEMSFEQMLEESLKTIRQNEIVEGTVIDVKPDEIVLNIGYKSDGIISRSEYTNEPNVDLTTLVSVGDKMEAKVKRVNDGEGQLLLHRHLDLHVPPVVVGEDLPLVRGVKGEVPGPSSVGEGGAAWPAEILYERCTLLHLPLSQLQHPAYPVQGERESHVCAPYPRASPSVRVEEAAGGVVSVTIAMEDFRPVPSEV